MDIWKRLSNIFICCCVGFSCFISPGSAALQLEEQLCDIQCHLFCKNQESLNLQIPICANCSLLQKGPWLYNCSRPAECSGRCYMFKYLEDDNLLPAIPKLESKFLSVTEIQLHWFESFETKEVTYLVQEKVNEKWIEKTQLNNTKSLVLTNLDVCIVHQYRIIAINKYGSSGASNELIIDKPKIGNVTDVHLVKNWHFDNMTGEFKAIIECGIPKGWREADFDGCVYGILYKNCPQHFNSPEQFSLYFDTKDKTRTQLRILSKAFSCSYIMKANAVSRCKEKGGSVYYKLNLTECAAIRGFACPRETVNPPGVVEDVHIHVSYDGNVDIGWKPPSDLGSAGVVNTYGIRWGKVELEIEMLDFITLGSAAHVRTVQQNFTRIFLKRYEPHKIYGIQIIALYPGQSFGADEWDLFTVYPFCYKGEGDLNIDSVSNLRQVNVSLVTARWPVKVCSNLTKIEMYKRYAIRWGPADSTDVESMTITSLEGTAIFSVNTFLLFNITQPGVPYGMMVIPLKSNDYLPTDEDWKNATSYSFIVQSKSSHETKKDKNWRGLAVGLGIAISVMLLSGTFIYRRNKTKYLPRLNEEHAVSSPHIYYVQPVERYLPHNHLIRATDTVEQNWEVPYQSLRFQEELGRGAFGKVFKAEINSCWLLRNKQSEDPPKRLTVAVKMLHESAKEIFQMDFIREIQVMKKIGYHENIVSVLGCCTVKMPICLIVEHIPLGDLLSYLRNQRQNIKNDNREEDFSLHYVNCSDRLTSSKLISMAQEIACGMEYLSSKDFIHRDLAARNVLVGENLTMKIGDFGLTRYVYNDKVYVNLKGGKLPIKWMSIEAIFDRTFSTASDVWSFGILLYEIISLGGVPYPTLDASNLLKKLGKGYRMERPDNCSHQLYDLMLTCWRTTAEDRPRFGQLVTKLEAIRTSGEEHIMLRAGFEPDRRLDIPSDEARKVCRGDKTDTDGHHLLVCSSSFPQSPSLPLQRPPSHSSSSPLLFPYSHTLSSSSFSPYFPSPPPFSHCHSEPTSSAAFSLPTDSPPPSSCSSSLSSPPPPPNTPFLFSSTSSSLMEEVEDEEDEEDEDVFVDQFHSTRNVCGQKGFVNASYTGTDKGLILRPYNLDRKTIGSILSTSSTSQLIR